jgi:hypothetical protein
MVRIEANWILLSSRILPNEVLGLVVKWFVVGCYEKHVTRAR